MDANVIPFVSMKLKHFTVEKSRLDTLSSNWQVRYVFMHVLKTS